MPDPSPLVHDPFARFREWMAEAEASEPASQRHDRRHGDAGRPPSARAILLKGVDARGFVFYTNKQSRKSADSPPTRTSRCCSTGSRWPGRSASRARWNLSPMPRPTRISRPGRAFRGWAPGRPTSRARWTTALTLERRLAEYDSEIPGRGHPASAALVGLPRPAATVSSSGRTCRSACTTAPSSRATAMAAGRSASCFPDRAAAIRRARRSAEPMAVPPEQGTSPRSWNAWRGARRSRRISRWCSSAPIPSGN